MVASEMGRMAMMADTIRPQLGFLNTATAVSSILNGRPIQAASFTPEKSHRPKQAATR